MFGWMGRRFKILQPGTDAQSLTPMDNLRETRKKLEEELAACKKEASQEVKNKDKFVRVGDIEAASRCLDLKGLYEELIRKLGYCQFQTKKMIIKLKEAEATALTVKALKMGEAKVQELQGALNIDDGNDIMNEINELRAGLGQNQDPLPATSGVAADSNEAGMAL